MDRWSVALVALLMTVSALPVADAQATQEFEVLQDSSGDVTVSVAGTPGTDVAGLHDYLDLLSVEVVEEQEGFRFTTEAVDLNSKTAPFYEGGRIHVYFRHADTQFRISYGLCNVCINTEPIAWADLYASIDGDDVWSWRHSGWQEMEVDWAAGIIEWLVPRDALVDGSGATPFPGRTLTEFYAESQYWTETASLRLGPAGQYEFPIAVNDRVPEQGFSDISVPVLFGLAQTGHARLASNEPFRASNGEATTFLYEVNASNIGQMEDVFTLAPTSVPGTWDVTLPQPTIVLGAGESRLIPVIVSTPFNHQHGAAESFVLEMTSFNDASAVGRVELGIRFLAIPAPAGHHDTVYLHQRAWNFGDSPFNQALGTALTPIQGDGYGYMNTLQNDEGDAGGEVVAQSWGFNPFGTAERPVTSTFRWLTYLEPTLRLGLDFDLAGQIELQFPIEVRAPMPATVIKGAVGVVYGYNCCDGDFDENWGWYQATTVSEFALEPQDLNLGDLVTLDVDMDVLPEADFFEYLPGQNLAMVVWMETVRPQTFVGAERPALLPGGSVRLPLFEYHDPIDAAFQAATGPILEVAGAAGRAANPGDLVLFDVTMRDAGAAQGDYEISIAGQNAAWAQLHSRNRVSLPSGGSESIQVAVHVPDGARHGDRADVFVQAVAADDPSRRGLLRLVVDVDTENEHVDDQAAVDALGPANRDAPAVPLVMLLAALAAVLALRRRS